MLRHVSLAEGLSFLVLLLIAMPVKYLLGEPFVVRIAGSLHGVFTVALLAAAVRALSAGTVPIRTLFWVLVFSVIPFGFIAAERRLASEGEEPLAGD